MPRAELLQFGRNLKELNPVYHPYVDGVGLDFAVWEADKACAQYGAYPRALVLCTLNVPSVAVFPKTGIPID